MKKTILIVFLLLRQLIAFSQIDSTAMSIGLGFGIDMISNKDIAASPLAYQGFGIPVGINGFKLSKKWINHFEFQFISPLFTNNYALSSIVDTRLKSWTKANFRYQLLRQIGADPNNFLGGAIESSFFYREYNFLDGFAWEFQNSLNIVYARKISLGSKSFLLPKVSIPLFGYINRKPSLTFDEAFLDDFNNKGASSLLKYGEWAFQFDQWVSFELDILYHLKLSNRFSFQTSLGLNYYSIEFPERLRNINVPIRCYINYQF